MSLVLCMVLALFLAGACRHLALPPRVQLAGVAAGKRASWLSNVVFMATVLVNGGTAIISNRLLGSGTEPKYIGWGTGTQTTAVVGDTGLGPTTVERDVDLSGTTGSRTTGTSSQQTTTLTGDTYQVTGTRTATGAGTTTVAGLFDNATIGSGTLFVKGDYTGIGLGSGDSVAYTFKVKFLAG